jgi:hypothetical protein
MRAFVIVEVLEPELRLHYLLSTGKEKPTAKFSRFSTSR